MSEASLNNFQKISREELLIRLNMAKLFKKYGGKINFLLYHLDGFAEFLYLHFIRQGCSSSVFLKDFKKKYPSLKPEYYPSLTIVKKARVVWQGKYKDHIMGVAMKDIILKIDKVIERRDKAKPFLFNP